MTLDDGLTVTGHLWLLGDPPAPPRALEALGDLLGRIVDGHPFRWSFCCDLGPAGRVTIAFQIDPTTTPEHEVDTILSTAARLANWSYT